jgi:type IV pilus assembly protein PilB
VRMGELLVNSGMVTKDQMDYALKIQRETKQKLGEVLIREGILTERQILEVLEFQLGFPVVNLFEVVIDAPVLKLVPESIARKYVVIPLDRTKDKIKVAMNDPLNYDAIEEIRMSTGLTVLPFIASKMEIEQAISKYYGLRESVDALIGQAEVVQEVETDQDSEYDSESPIIKLVNQIIHTAVQQKVSDIHIESQEKNVVVRFRVDGVLRTEKTLPKNTQNVIISRLKIVAKLNIAEKRLPQDGRIQMNVDSRRIDIRVSTLPSVHGESVVMRILDQSSGIKKITELGFLENNQRQFEKLLNKPNGIILITGPTGSGKTSTLYSGLKDLNHEDVKIITVEDPVEYRMEGITQVQVNAQIGLTFASGLRSILRQDPNIVMVGEIRDTETAEIAIRASLTGHLVLSTLHTNGAVDTISRLMDMGIESYLIASSLNGIVAQRLVRRICPDCKTRVQANDQIVELYKKMNVTPSQSPLQIYHGKGCTSCHKSGYRGRVAIHEVLTIDEPMRRLIAQNISSDEMRIHLAKSGFRNMFADGLVKSMQGLTTVEEVVKAVSED